MSDAYSAEVEPSAGEFTPEQKSRAISIKPSNTAAGSGDDFGEPIPPSAALPADDFGEPVAPINTKKGANFGMRVAMQRTDNPDEAKLLMEGKYGRENVGQTKKGDWWFKDPETGEQTAVFADPGPSALTQWSKDHPALSAIPMGPLPINTKKIGQVADWINSLAPKLPESMVAAANPTAGSMLGATGGAMVGGPFGAAVGGGLGYVAGKGIDELVKGLQGFHSKTPGEEAHALFGPEAAMSMLQPGTGGGVGRAYKTKFMGVTPQSSQMTRETTEEGARVPIGSLATEATGFETKRKFAKSLSGDMHRDQNVKWLESQLLKQLEDTGVPPHEARQLLDQMWSGGAAVEGKYAAQSVVDAAMRKNSALEMAAHKHMLDAKQMTDDVEGMIKTWSGSAPRNMGVDIGQTILKARGQFSRDSNAAVKQIHDMTGGTPIVPMDEAIAAAKRLIDISPPNSLPQFVVDVSKMPPGTLLPLEPAHNYRNLISAAERRMVQGGNLTPGVDYHYFREMEKALDSGIDTVAAHTQGDVGAALKRFANQYREGIVTFKNAKARALMNDIQKGKVPEPYEVARDILEAGAMQDVLAIKKYLAPEQIENVAKAFTENLIRASSTEASEQSAKLAINPQTLLRNLEKYQDVMRTFGISPKFIGEMKEFANSLRARNERLDPDFLRAGPIRQKMAEWRVAQRELDDFVVNDPLAAFRSGNAASHDAALNFVANPSNWTKIKPVVSAMSPAERDTLHTYMVERLLNEVTSTTAERLPQVKGNAIKQWLAPYTAEQQDILLGHGVANDLKRLGDKVNFIFRDDAVRGGEAQIVAGVKEKGFLNPFALQKRLRWYFTTLAVHQPKVLSWFADIAERDPSQFRLAAGALNRWLLTAAMTGPGQGKPAPPPIVGAEGAMEPTKEKPNEQPQRSPLTGNQYIPDPARPGKYLRVDH